MRRTAKQRYTRIFRPLQIVALASCGIFGLSLCVRASSVPHVELKRVPEGGIQPQTAVDQNGTIHLVYFKGEPSEGDLFYARSKNGETFSKPIRVNSAPGPAVAVGNIRGARIAVGRRGQVYVLWNGSRKTADPAQGRSPLFFARLNGEVQLLSRTQSHSRGVRH